MIGRGRGHSAVLFALIAGSAGALASCGFIVGVGDYVIGDAASDATADQENDVATGADRLDTGGGGDATDAAMGDAMRDAPGDSANERMDAKSDGTPNVDGAVGDVESGSEDADGGLPEADAGVECGEGIPTTNAFSNLVQTCVAIASCDPYLLPMSLSNCIGNAALFADGDAGPLSCLSTIADCYGYYQCQGIRVANGLNSTECSGTASSCDTMHNIAYDCSSGSDGGVPGHWGTVTNCAPTDGGCQTFTDSYGNSRAGCVIVPSCTVPDGGGWECSGNNAYQCISADGGSKGVGYGYNCGSATCLGQAGGPPCTFVGTGSCASPTNSRCNGDVLRQSCTSPSVLNYDCTIAGGSCASNGTSSACVSPGCTLNSSCTESCDGFSTITTCVGGAAYSFDCTNYGSPQFAFCAANDTGSPAWCVP